MRHLGLGLMACLLLVGMGVAQDGFEHREFTNQEGVHLSYNINNIGLIEYAN
jgi:NhaP-type Na+/H+ and K+/H+ antiporter